MKSLEYIQCDPRSIVAQALKIEIAGQRHLSLVNQSYHDVLGNESDHIVVNS